MHQAASRERQRLIDEPVPVEPFHAEVDELCALSNRVKDLIRAGALDDAEEISHELLRRFPGQMNGLEGLASVYDARGNAAKAAEYYRKAALFAEQGDGYDPLLSAGLRCPQPSIPPARAETRRLSLCHSAVSQVVVVYAETES